MATYKNEINNQIVTTVQISGDAKIAELESALERSEQRVSQLNTELQESAVRVSELVTRLHEVESASGITAMREELERFQQTAVNSAREFEAFLQTTRLIGVDDYAGFSDRFGNLYAQVSDGAKTAQQAISEVKREYSALVTENAGSAGGVFDAQSAQQLSATLMKISESIDIVLSKVNEIQSEGVRVSGEMGEISSSGASMASVLDKISAAASGMDGDLRSSYDAITQLTQAMIGYSNVDGEKLLQISNTFRNIGTIGNGKFSDKAMANIVRTVGELQTLSAGGQSIKIDVSGLEALSGLKVSKAALVNLKEYLPQIAAVNTSGLKKLAGINFDNLNNLKVSKASVSNLADLANISKTLEELKTRVDAVAPSIEQLSAAETSVASADESTVTSKQRAAEAYKNASAAIKEYYSVFTTLAKTKSADITYGNGEYTSKSGNYTALAAELTRVTLARQKLTSEEAKASMTENQAAALAQQEAAAKRNYLLTIENEANKERESAAAKERAAAASQREAAANKANSEIKKQNAANTKLLLNVEKNYKATLEEANTALSSWTAGQHSFSASSRKAYTDLEAAVSAMNNAASEFNSDENINTATRLNNSISKVKETLQNTRLVLKENNDATKSFSDRVGNLASKFTAWFSASQLVMYAINGIRKMITNVVELDTAMTELKKVTDETDATYEKFLTNAASRATNLGATITDTVTATADFARLGYNLNDASSLADAAIVYKNVGDGIGDINTASESVISTMKSFGIEASDAMSIVDKFNEVGNNYAISSKGVGEALLRSASAMHAAGNDINETIALATAANTIIQNPESVGTALKTVSMFLRAAKTEAQEAGEDTEGMAESVSKLRGEILALTKGKVDIQIDENNFKSTTQILRELAEVWDELSDVTQANILEKIGGKRNANVTSALIQNFDLVEDVIRTSQNAEGSALAENDKYLESINGHIAKFKANFESLSKSLVNSDLVKFVVDTGTVIIKVLDGVAKLVNSLGGVKLVLTAISGLIVSMKIDSAFKFFDKFKTGGTSIQKFGENLLDAIGNLKMMNLSAQNATGALVQLGGSGSFVQRLGIAFREAGIEASAAQIAITGVTLAIGAGIAIFSLVNSAIQKHKQALQEDREEAIAAGEAASESAKSIYESYESYNKAKLAMDGTTEASAQLESASQSLADSLGVEKSAVDELADSYEGLTAARLKTAINDLEEAKIAAEESVYQSYKDAGELDRNTILSAMWSGAGIRSNEFNAQSTEEKTLSLISALDELIARRDKLIKQGDTESAEYKKTISAIDVLKGSVGTYTSTVSNLAKVSEHYIDVLDDVGSAGRTSEALGVLFSKRSHNELGGGADFASMFSAVSEEEEKNFNRVNNLSVAYSKLQSDIEECKASGEDYSDLQRRQVSIATEAAGLFPKLNDALHEQGLTFKDLMDVMDETGLSLEELIEESTLYADSDMGLSEKIDSLTSLSDELTKASEALTNYNNALEGGEKGDVASGYGDAYKKFAEDWEAGRTGTNAVRAAVELFIPDEVLSDMGYDLQQAGELLSSDLYSSIFNNSDSEDYGLNFFNYIKDNIESVSDKIAQIQPSEDGFVFSYSSISDLADAFGMTKETVTALLDALDAYGVHAMMGAADTNELAAALGLASGQAISTKAEIQGVIDKLAAEGRTAFDIQQTLMTLQDAGYIDITMDATELGEMIQKAREADTEIQNLDSEKPDIEIKTNHDQVMADLEHIDNYKFQEKTITTRYNTVGSPGGGLFSNIFSNFKQANAVGTDDSPGGKTLVNELGPELISENGKAYIAGGGLPTVVDLDRHAIVLTADETKKALGDSKKIPKHSAAIGLSNIYSGTYQKKYSSGTAVSSPVFKTKDTTTEAVINIKLDGNANPVAATVKTPNDKSGTKSGGSTSSGGSSGGSSSGSTGGSSGSSSKEESEFEKAYKEHQHLLKMEKEDEAEYVDWLESAYKDAYKKQEIELDDYYKY